MWGQPRACRAGDIGSGIPPTDDQAGSVEQQPRGRVCISSMPHFSGQADDHFISAERKAAHVRSLHRRHDDIHVSSQCLGDGNDDHGEARRRTLHLRRRCTRLAVATTLPRVIALGSVCAVRAPGIVARDGGDRCRARPDVRAPGRAGMSCRRRHRMPGDDHKASKGVDHGRFRALHRFRDSRTRP